MLPLDEEDNPFLDFRFQHERWKIWFIKIFLAKQLSDQSTENTLFRLIMKIRQTLSSTNNFAFVMQSCEYFAKFLFADSNSSARKQKTTQIFKLE